MLVDRLARLGCTRIGSPGIFGERNPKALFRAVKPQVAHERTWVGHRVSSCAWTRAGSARRVDDDLPRTEGGQLGCCVLSALVRSDSFSTIECRRDSSARSCFLIGNLRGSASGP